MQHPSDTLYALGLACRHRGTPRHRALVATCCGLARLALSRVPAGEMRPLRAIEAAERYARGEDIPCNDILVASHAAACACASAGRAADAAACAAACACASGAAAAYDAAACARAAIMAGIPQAQCEDIVQQCDPGDGHA